MRSVLQASVLIAAVDASEVRAADFKHGAGTPAPAERVISLISGWASALSGDTLWFPTRGMKVRLDGIRPYALSKAGQRKLAKRRLTQLHRIEKSQHFGRLTRSWDFQAWGMIRPPMAIFRGSVRLAQGKSTRIVEVDISFKEKVVNRTDVTIEEPDVSIQTYSFEEIIALS